MKWIPIHDVVQSIGSDMALGIPYFHALTSSDFTSGFRGYGKVSAWRTWQVFPEITRVFTALSDSPESITPTDQKLLEKFVCVMYDRSAPVFDVNSLRLYLFTKKQRSYDNIPPSQNILHLHFKRAAFVGGHMWGQSLQRIQQLPDPTSWGWILTDGTWKINWMTVDPLSKECRILKKCNCTSDCVPKPTRSTPNPKGKCGCFRDELSCTPLCKCKCNSIVALT